MSAVNLPSIPSSYLLPFTNSQLPPVSCHCTGLALIVIYKLSPASHMGSICIARAIWILNTPAESRVVWRGPEVGHAGEKYSVKNSVLHICCALFTWAPVPACCCCRYCAWCHNWWRNVGTRLPPRVSLRCAYAKLCRNLHCSTTARFRRAPDIMCAAERQFHCCIVLMCEMVLICGWICCVQNERVITWLHNN